jgi:hypothetical protein
LWVCAALRIDGPRFISNLEGLMLEVFDEIGEFLYMSYFEAQITVISQFFPVGSQGDGINR